jgi:transcriptional regulator of acetoin/glycerol metabolism
LFVGVDGRLVAILDVSAFDPDLSGRSHGLTLPLVVASARALEERLFREAFAHYWIAAVPSLSDERPAALLAIDRAHRIVGADRNAREVRDSPRSDRW